MACARRPGPSPGVRPDAGSVRRTAECNDHRSGDRRRPERTRRRLAAGLRARRLWACDASPVSVAVGAGYRDADRRRRADRSAAVDLSSLDSDPTLRHGDCIVLDADLRPTEVSCSLQHDAVIELLVPFGTSCPEPTLPYRNRTARICVVPALSDADAAAQPVVIWISMWHAKLFRNRSVSLTDATPFR